MELTTKNNCQRFNDFLSLRRILIFRNTTGKSSSTICDYVDTYDELRDMPIGETRFLLHTKAYAMICCTMSVFYPMVENGLLSEHESLRPIVWQLYAIKRTEKHFLLFDVNYDSHSIGY